MLANLAQKIPDLPRWVEARALLLTEACEIYGLQETPELALVVREPEHGTVFVIGTPAVAALQAAIQHHPAGGEVIAPFSQTAWLAAALPGWAHTRIIVHQLAEPNWFAEPNRFADPQHLPVTAAGQVGFLDPATLPQLALPEALRAELLSGAEYSLIAATFVAAQPVAFCYAGAETETLWDVAIDTLPEHRRKGYAALCAVHLIRHMAAKGKRPVWQAVEENPASWQLAQKLGFVPMDELVMFEQR